MKNLVFVEFTSATCSNEGQGVKFEPVNKIRVNVDRIVWFKDHAIIVEYHRIQVMESYDEIKRIIREAMA